MQARWYIAYYIVWSAFFQWQKEDLKSAVIANFNDWICKKPDTTLFLRSNENIIIEIDNKKYTDMYEKSYKLLKWLDKKRLMGK